MGRKAARKVIPASQFKATCLALMDEVERGHSEIVVTKHRKPVAKLVPFTTPEPTPFIGRSAGMIESHADLIAPVGPDW